MKKALFSALFLLALALFTVPAIADGGVPVDSLAFPDDAFRAYVSANCDVDSDGVLSDAEIMAVTYTSI